MFDYKQRAPDNAKAWDENYARTFGRTITYLKAMYVCSRCGAKMPMEDRIPHGPSNLCTRTPPPDPERPV